MKKIISFFLLIATLVPNAFAESRAGWYQANIPVATQDEEVRQQAVRTGLIGILIKLTADPNIGSKSELKSSIEKASYYVNEYSYLPATSGYQLQIYYEEKTIKGLLRRNQIPFWNERRPTVLVWLSYKEKGHDPEFIGNDSSNSLLPTFTDESKKFGIPLIFPIMDLTDMDQMVADSIMKMPPDAFKAASKRYSPQAILIGEISGEEGNYMSEWKLLATNKTWVWSINRNTLTQVADDIMTQAGQTLSKQYITVIDDAVPQPLTLEVANITKKDDIANLIKYLKQLSNVDDVELLELKGNVVQLSLQLKGQVNAFQEDAALGQKLVLKSQDLANNKLWYEWVH